MSHKPVSPNNRSRERERQALLSYAFFRWESAVILALMLILVIFVPDPFRGAASFWGWWMWLALGLLAEALIVGTTLADRDVRARIASQLLGERFDLDRISDNDLRQQIVKALDTRAQMEVVLQRIRGRASGAQWDALGDEVSDWIESMYRLARRLDEVHDRAELYRRPNALPAEIQALEQDLERMAERASTNLDEDQGALQAIYTQMQLAAARGADGRRVRQLRDEIAGHAQSLSELDREIAKSFEQIAEKDALNHSG